MLDVFCLAIADPMVCDYASFSFNDVVVQKYFFIMDQNYMFNSFCFAVILVGRDDYI